MLLVAPGLATRNKRPLEPKASPLIENEEAGMRKRKRKRSRGQQGVHSSAANEDSCGYSVKQIGTPICVPAI